jgi:small conductance mechanosensitive channel
MNMIEMVKNWIYSLSGFAFSKILPAVTIVVIGILAVRILMKTVGSALEKSKLEKAAHSLIKSLLQAVLYVLLGLVVASKLGIDVTGIIALASVLSLAVSLAVQDVLTNVFGGLTLLYTQPFHSGDYVEIAGQGGTVKEIGLSYTKLTTPDNKEISIPNKNVVSADIVNYTVTGKRRVDFTVTASYDAPIKSVLNALRKAANVSTRLESEEPFVAVSNYGDHAIEYVLRVWSTTDDYWTTKFEINEKIKEVFDADGIEMTYPHLNIHLDKGE